ncbi:MAG: outer membrane protein assembly factor BamB family protein [Ktedonobacteraceae bacterium]
MKRKSIQQGIALLAIVGMLAMFRVTSGDAATAHAATNSATKSSGSWSTYLYNNDRDGFDKSETIINPTSAKKLKQKWVQTAGGLISVQPVEANNLVYWGAWGDGLERATSLSGTQVWATSVGVSPPANCGTHTLGVASTATIATETINGASESVLYVGGGDVNFYALNAKTGAKIWETPLGTKPNYFIWSSPAVYNGSVYIGLSSRGDCPLVRGELVQMDAATGAIQHIFYTVPANCVGASVWGSVAIDKVAGTIYFVTGNGGNCSGSEPYAVAIVELHTSDLSLVGSWQVPSSQQGNDSDFGTTPAFFNAVINGKSTKLVGAPNKNGIFYTFKRDALTSGPIWEDAIAKGGECPQCGNGSISPAAWNGSTLFAAGGNTTIKGTSCAGSVRAINPATGAYIWQACFQDGPIIAAVSGVPGVIFVGEGSHFVAVATASGKTLFNFDTGAQIYAASSISSGVVYFGSTNNNMYAYAP